MYVHVYIYIYRHEHALRAVYEMPRKKCFLVGKWASLSKSRSEDLMLIFWWCHGDVRCSRDHSHSEGAWCPFRCFFLENYHRR